MLLVETSTAIHAHVFIVKQKIRLHAGRGHFQEKKGYESEGIIMTLSLISKVCIREKL